MNPDRSFRTYVATDADGPLLRLATKDGAQRIVGSRIDFTYGAVEGMLYIANQPDLINLGIHTKRIPFPWRLLALQKVAHNVGLTLTDIIPSYTSTELKLKRIFSRVKRKEERLRKLSADATSDDTYDRLGIVLIDDSESSVITSYRRHIKKNPADIALGQRFVLFSFDPSPSQQFNGTIYPEGPHVRRVRNWEEIKKELPQVKNIFSA